MFQGDGNAFDKKKPQMTTAIEKSFERDQKNYQNFPPSKDISPVSNIPPYQGIYHQPPTSMHFPGYIMPQTPQGPHNYPPSDIYFIPNAFYGK